MKTIELKAEIREKIGTRENKKLRAAGKVPGVLYDQGKATHISVDAKEVRSVLFTPETYIINMDISGSPTSAIVREAQYHPVKEHVLHVDFLKVTDDKEVILELPVSLEGTPAGVFEGGKLVTKIRRLKVKGIPSKLPDQISIDVTELLLGNTIKVSDANIDIEGLEVVTSASAAVASVEIPRALRSAGALDGEEGDEGGEEAEGGDEE